MISVEEKVNVFLPLLLPLLHLEHTKHQMRGVKIIRYEIQALTLHFS